MKQHFLQVGILCLILNLVLFSSAQDSLSLRPAAPGTYINTGQSKQNISTYRGNVLYQLEMVNDSISSLSVDGRRVPGEEYVTYSSIITSIREELRRNILQAKKDQEAAMLNQHKAKLAQEKAMQHQQQAKLAQEEAGRQQLLAKQDEERANRELVIAKMEIAAAAANQQLAVRQQEQAARSQQAAQLAKANALADQKRAAEDQQLLKNLMEDLVKDAIAPDEKSIREVVLTETEMTVNGKQQGASTLRKYKEKYARLAAGNLHLTNENRQQLMQLHSKE
ncbi:MAG TPA: hypothetical protein VL307_16960 [Chitinophagaceae bacterium]|nr:hypothetical protein [Chitinophagaceae bacterium]